MVEAYDIGYGAWLMHDLVKVWCMVNAQFGTGCGTWLMFGMVNG